MTSSNTYTYTKVSLNISDLWPLQGSSRRLRLRLRSGRPGWVLRCQRGGRRRPGPARSRWGPTPRSTVPETSSPGRPRPAPDPQTGSGWVWTPAAPWLAPSGPWRPPPWRWRPGPRGCSLSRCRCLRPGTRTRSTGSPWTLCSRHTIGWCRHRQPPPSPPPPRPRLIPAETRCPPQTGRCLWRGLKRIRLVGKKEGNVNVVCYFLWFFGGWNGSIKEWSSLGNLTVHITYLPEESVFGNISSLKRSSENKGTSDQSEVHEE